MAVESTNTGYKAYKTLEEYDVATGIATGVTKPNDPNDADYVEPVYDLSACPLPEPVQPEPEPEVNVSLSPARYDAQYIDFFTLQVTSNSDWQLIPSVNWITVSPSSGSGNASVQVQVSKNNSSEERFGSIEAQDADGNPKSYCAISQVAGLTR